MAASRRPAKRSRSAEIRAGVIGLGLMGRSSAACLLSAGHPVVAVTRSVGRHRGTRRHILDLLREMTREGLLKRSPEVLIDRLQISEDSRELADCGIVIESLVEDLETRWQAYRAIEQVVSPRTIIGSNTSSIPLTLLQQNARYPERFVGIHWYRSVRAPRNPRAAGETLASNVVFGVALA